MLHPYLSIFISCHQSCNRWMTDWLVSLQKAKHPDLICTSMLNVDIWCYILFLYQTEYIRHLNRST